MSSFWPIRTAPMCHKRSRGSRRASVVNRDFSADWHLSNTIPRFSKIRKRSRRHHKPATNNLTKRSCNKQVRKRRKKSSSGLTMWNPPWIPQSRRRCPPSHSSKVRSATTWRRFWVVWIQILAGHPLVKNNNNSKRLDSSFSTMDLVSTWSPCGSHRRPMSRPPSSSRKASRT